MKERTGGGRGGPMREAKTRKGGDRREGGRPPRQQQPLLNARIAPGQPNGRKKTRKEGRRSGSGDPMLSYTD